MTIDQANAIIDSITGLPHDHWDRLDTAAGIGHKLIEAVETIRSSVLT